MSEELAEQVKSGEDLSTGTRRLSDPLRKMAHKTRQDERQHAQHRKERDKKDEGHVFEAIVLSDLASAERIAAFQNRLDDLDRATIEALEENERQLAQARAARDAILAQAYVLEDGRRVFRTADGSAVIDEHGNPVGADVVDPDEIPHSAPTWEDFLPTDEPYKRLQEERAALLEFQEKLDEMREALAAGEITEDQLKEMEAALIADMPAAVRAQLPAHDAAAQHLDQHNPDRPPQRDAVASPSLDGLEGFVPPIPGG